MSKMIMIPFALGITQQRKLRSAVKNGDGLKLRLPAAAIGAGKEIHLAVTETQAQRLMKRKQAGLGMDITFSASSLKQSAKHGSGFFSNILRKAASAGVRGLSGLAADAIGGGFNDFRVANMSTITISLISLTQKVVVSSLIYLKRQPLQVFAV